MGKNVSLEDVERAVQELLASDDSRVSVSRVIRHLRRGSATTVTKHLRTIREAEGGEPKLLEAAEGKSEDMIAALAANARLGAEAMFMTLIQPISELEKRQQEYLNDERKKLQMDSDQVILEAIAATQRAEMLQAELFSASTKIGEMNAELQLAKANASSAERAERKRAAMDESRRQGILTELCQMRDKFQESVKESAELRGQLSASENLIKEYVLMIQRLLKYANANKYFQRRLNRGALARGLLNGAIDLRSSATMKPLKSGVRA